MTMINFKRTGGAEGPDLSESFDLGSMPGDAAQRVHGLLTASNFFEIPLVEDLRAGPGEHEYIVSVVAGNSIHTVHVTDSTMPQSMRPLVDELTMLAEAAA